MRPNRILVAATLALFCASCSGHTRTVTTPMRSATLLEEGGFYGVLILKDGRRLPVDGASLIQGWVCGRPDHASWSYYAGESCVAADRIGLLERQHHTPGVGNLIATGLMAIVVWPIFVGFGLDEHQKAEDYKEQLREKAAERRRDDVTSAAEGLPPLRVRRAGRGLARCKKDQDAEAARTADANALAREVLQLRETRCVNLAIIYYEALDRPDLALPLVLTQLARARFEALACGGSDPGLQAPAARQVSGVSGWMAQYRAIAADPTNYDHQDFDRPCRSSPTGDEPSQVIDPDPTTRREARRLVTATFPLTELAPAAA